MAKHKVAELEGSLLDAAVHGIESGCFGYPNAYSTDWQHGGPIIEREGMCIQSPEVMESDDWIANVYRSGGKWRSGPTLLVACMRAYVASKFGEEVEL
jgi:hypothetical protein